MLRSGGKAVRYITSQPSLFPTYVVGEMTAEKQARRGSSLFSDIVKLSDSAQKVVQSQRATSLAGHSAPPLAQQRRGKRKLAPPQTGSQETLGKPES